MGRSVTVSLGDNSYSIPKLNIGQLKRTTRLSAKFADQDPYGKMEVGIEILAIALERADPKVPNIDDLEAGAEEIAEAVTAVMGMNRKPKPTGEENPPA